MSSGTSEEPGQGEAMHRFPYAGGLLDNLRLMMMTNTASTHIVDAPNLASLATPAQVVPDGSVNGRAERLSARSAQEKRADEPTSPADEKIRVVSILLTEDKNTTAIERLLVDVIAQEVPLVGALEKAKLELAARLLPNIDNPRAALKVAQVLKEVVVTSNAITKRVEHLLGSLATLRSQRRLLEQHRGSNGK